MTRYALIAAIAFTVAAAPALAAGGKNRLSEIRTDIEEVYLLCQQAGVESIVVEQDGITVTVRCEPADGAPGQADPG